MGFKNGGHVRVEGRKNGALKMAASGHVGGGDVVPKMAASCHVGGGGRGKEIIGFLKWLLAAILGVGSS